MDDQIGYEYSWSGFLDYINCYHEVKPIWIAVGACIFVGTVLSLIPQIFRIIRAKSSYGISPIFALITSLGQFLTVINIICLHNADFYGIVQISLARTVPRFLTFLNCFSLWYVYLIVVFLVMIFFDKRPNPNRNENNIKREWTFSVIIEIIILTSGVVFFLAFIICSVKAGFGSDIVLALGKFCGSASSVLSICQYLPQFITTCKIKDNGSLSLVTLLIQAPGGTINALFMIFGQGEHWTTWLPVLLSALQQFMLLGICIYFKVRNKILNADDESITISKSEKFTQMDINPQPILSEQQKQIQ